eukprot:9817656-Ditylum_brightwellii.AAC.2
MIDDNFICCECAVEESKAGVEDVFEILKCVIPAEYHRHIMEAAVKYKMREVGHLCCDLTHIGCSTSLNINYKDGHEYTCEEKRG